MTKENIQAFAVALNSSPSEGAGEGTEAKRNKKTQLLSALLSASALGVFLEGCGDGGGGDYVRPTTAGVTGDGSRSSPLVATDKADILEGNWVSYAGSNAGVTVNLGGSSGPEASGGWAWGDRLGLQVSSVVGSAFPDTFRSGFLANIFEGGKGDDTFQGYHANSNFVDTYVFNSGDGKDRIISSKKANIVFEQGADSSYAGANYNFAYVNGLMTLKVTSSDGNTLNTIELSHISSTNIPGTFGSNARFTPSNFDFYTRSGDVQTEIPVASLVLPTIRGSGNNPHLASNNADTFYGIYTRDFWVSYENSNEGVTIELVDTYALTLPFSETARVSGGWAEGDTLIEIKHLIGSNHADTLIGNHRDNTLMGGDGNDLLDGGGRGGQDSLHGEGGADTYRFDRSGYDSARGTIFAENDGINNKVVFRAPEGVTYTNDNFEFIRGVVLRDGIFYGRETGDDLNIIVSVGMVNENRVSIKDYFDQPDSAYTIYSTSYRSSSDGTIVSTQPAETS